MMVIIYVLPNWAFPINFHTDHHTAFPKFVRTNTFGRILPSGLSDRGCLNSARPNEA